MRLLPRLSILPSTLLLLAALAALPAQAGQFSGLYVFGDSLSDSGNNAAVIGTQPTQVINGNGYVALFPSGAGTYSNGKVWSQLAAESLGLSATPSLAFGSNFAFGGAETSREINTGGFTPPSLRRQANGFLAASGSTISGSGLYVVEGGGNNARRVLMESIFDSQTAFQTRVAAEATAYATDIKGIVDDLQVAGAKNIIVWNTPNIGLTPMALSFGSGVPFLASSIAAQFNAELAARLAGEAGVNIYDVFSGFTALTGMPGAFGLTNVADACGNPSLACSTDIAHSLFWDGVHPTTAGHQLLANGVLALAVPEPSTYAMFLVGLIGCGWVVRRRRD